METPGSTTKLVIKENPIFLWILGLMFLVPGVVILFQPNGLISGLIIASIGLLLFLVVATIHTIVVDRDKGTLTIRHQNLVRNKVQEFGLSEVANFTVEASRTHYRSSRRSRSSGQTYRVVMIKTTGETVPLETEYSSGYNGKAKKARQLCEFLGLPGWEDKPTNLFQAVIQAQTAMTAASLSDSSQSGVTSGVQWSIELHQVGGQTVTRWVSSQSSWQNNFLFLSQKPKGSASTAGGGGLWAGLASMVYQQILGMYGIKPGDTPGIEHARGLGRVEPELDAYYAVLTSDPSVADSLITPWIIHPLKNWAEQHPMRTVQASGQPGQLVTLFSPSGVVAAVLGPLSEEQKSELIYLGVELVKVWGNH